MFGVLLAAVLAWLAVAPGGGDGSDRLLGLAIAAAMAVAAVLVFFATRGRHLGWLGLGLVAGLTTLGSLG